MLVPISAAVLRVLLFASLHVAMSLSVEWVLRQCGQAGRSSSPSERVRSISSRWTLGCTLRFLADDGVDDSPADDDEGFLSSRLAVDRGGAGCVCAPDGGGGGRRELDADDVGGSDMLPAVGLAAG